MRAELIYNPYAGQVAIRRELEDVVAFLNRNGWAVDKWEASKPMEATERARDAAKHGVEVVIAAGGDGTINEVASGLVGTDTALGVLPVGTTNTWALQMGIPSLNPILPSTSVAKFVADLEERIEKPLPANYYHFANFKILNAPEITTRNTIAPTIRSGLLDLSRSTSIPAKITPEFIITSFDVKIILARI